MAPNDKAGRVVFIGNIPYGCTEEMVVEVLGRVGQVLNFRLVLDKDTHRPKGFGFAEFSDADAAASAVRNLNDYDIMGRKLRVDWSNDNGAGDNAPAGYTNPPTAVTMNGQQEATPTQQSSILPPLPPGTELQPNITCPDAISRTLSTLPAPQLLDILSQMKGLVTTDPRKATELLSQAPQLSYAIFQSLLLLNLVDTTILSTIIEQAASSAPAAPQPPMPQPPRPAYPSYTPQPAPTPPVAAPQYQAPPPMPQQQQAIPGQDDLLKAVMAMSQQQIDALPPDQRMQIMQLRQGLMASGGPRY